MSTSLSRELLFLILQFLDEEKYKETMHKLEKESGLFFNMNYFDDCILNGEWEEVEKYLSGFVRVDDNRYTMKMFFEIRKQKYLEALDKQDRAKALEILRKELKMFAAFNDKLFKEIALLLTLQNFRENEQLSKYGDIKSARALMLVELKRLIDANSCFRDKLKFPTLKNSRLRMLINQGLNWQHQLCQHPKPYPEIRTLFLDHTCGQPAPTANPLMASVPNVGDFPVGAFGPFPSNPAPVASPGGWLAAPNSPSAPHQSGSGGPVTLSLAPPDNAASMLKRPRSPPPISNSALDYHSAGLEHFLRRTRPFMISEEARNLPPIALPASNPGQSHVHSAYSYHDLPKKVAVNLSQGSAVKSIDFHPLLLSVLLVGTNIGDVTVWEVSTKEKLVDRSFKVWNIGSCSMALQALLSNEPTASVNRAIWSPDGTLLGVAYSKNIFHLYTYHGGSDLREHLEIEAHLGNVNDIVFSSPSKKLHVITCGEEKSIKVWDADTGSKLYTFQGHEAAVYSLCPHYKENFIYSIDMDGKIRGWLYDNMGSRVQYEAPGRSLATMAYSADGTRLFLCGTNKEGQAYLVEWNENEGTVKRSYSGLGKRSKGVVQFDTLKNRFLAVGDEFGVKIWDMDEANVIKTIDAEGGLPASPCIRFDNEGSLLAISTGDNGVKILANAEGAHMLHAIRSRVMDHSRVAASSIAKGPMIPPFSASSSTAGTNINVSDRNAPVTDVVAVDADSRSPTELKHKIIEGSEKSSVVKLTEMIEPSQIRSFRLPDSIMSVRVVRLMYSSTGNAILALTYDAIHKLWKWRRNEGNLTGKATTAVPPQFCQAPNGTLMFNDISESNLEEAVPCLALSKNDSYVLSASGGKISLFNLLTFRRMTTFMSPPPAATFLAFHPQDNNIIAVGMEDATIQIYNIRVDEVTGKFKGHQNKVTGLAFSSVLLVSSGADAQVCVWNTDGWEKKANTFLQIPPGHLPNPGAHTRVQFHPDQTRVLVVHETQIAIYVASTLECIKQWLPPEARIAITDATYSCDGQSIYASLDDGSVYVITAAGLKQRCLINVTAYLPTTSSTKVHPVVIAAHPSEPNQIALGLTDGGVHIIEPLEGEGRWGKAQAAGQISNAASTGIPPIAAAAAYQVPI